MNKISSFFETEEQRRARRWNRIVDVVARTANAVGALTIIGALYLLLYVYDVGAVGMTESEYFLRVMSMLAAGAFLVIL